MPTRRGRASKLRRDQARSLRRSERRVQDRQAALAAGDAAWRAWAEACGYRREGGTCGLCARLGRATCPPPPRDGADI